MRHIAKRTEPPNWTKLRRRPLATWNDTPPALKAEVKDSLRREQEGLCAYCGTLLGDADHIEHFVPQSVDPRLIFDYDNLHASCNGPHGRHCGHARGHTYRPGMIPPSDPDCDGLFAFAADGGIDAMSDLPKTAGAVATIDLFRLDADPGLRRERKKAYEAIASVKKWAPSPDAERNELLTLRTMYSSAIAGKLKPFSFVYLHFIDEALRLLEI